MTLLAAIGDSARFPTAKRLVGYSGLGSRVHASGQMNHPGHITKQGRIELRTVRVECAWANRLEGLLCSPHRPGR
jgi:transposase